MTQSARKHALSLIIEQKKPPADALPLTKQLYWGTFEHWYELEDWLNNKLLQKPLKTKQHQLLCTLLLGLYQLRYMKTPQHAAVSETVRLAKAPWEKKLINACLRSACREPDFEPSTEAALYNHPDWLIQSIQRAYPEQWREILQGNQQKAPNTFRLRDRDTWLKSVTDLDAKPHPSCDTAAVITEYDSIHTLPGFTSGDCFVQDVAGQYVAPLLDAKAHERILDACSAPGGKGCHIGQHTPELDQLVCIELAEHRIGTLRDNLTRAGVTAEILCADASDYAFDDSFDRILIDAPCSSTGIIRRHPDIKLNRQPEDIPALNAIQAQLLQHLWAYLKPGGTLLYTTCSILPEENEHMIASFVETHADAVPQPTHVPNAIQKSYGCQLLPIPSPEHEGSIDWTSDGFYFCLIKKEHT